MVCRLFAGANGIRTIGPLMTKPPDSDVRGGPQAWIVLSRKNRHLVCGTCGSNLVSSSAESATNPRRSVTKAEFLSRHTRWNGKVCRVPPVGLALEHCAAQ